MKSKPLLIIAGSIAVVAAAVLIVRHLSGAAGETSLETAPLVTVSPVVRKDLAQVLTVQAEFRPYQEVELYAKVAGYLKTIDVDFGDRVQAGSEIAVLEVPELGDDLVRARAAEEHAEADYRDAHLDYGRLVSVNRSQPNLVAQQDLDSAESKDGATAAAVAAAKADVEKYQTLVSYTRITAPFDGVVTHRYADPGAMIQTASSSQTQAMPIVRLSENQRLRLDFPISVSYAQDVSVGDPVEIQLDGPSRPISAKITRFARRIDMATRTMETEVEVPNPDLRLIPGMYATVVLRLEPHPGALALPLEAVNAAGSPTVFCVGADGRLEERPVKLGLETPSYFEVISGLSEGDLVVVGSRAGLQPGERVTPRTIAASQ